MYKGKSKLFSWLLRIKQRSIKEEFDQVLSRGRNFCQSVEFAGVSVDLVGKGIDLQRRLIDDILASILMPTCFITFSTEEASFSSLER